MARQWLNSYAHYKLNVLVLPPLSLYIHFPWCEKKCPYCDFNSHVSTSGIPEKEYIQALINDLEHELPYVQGRKIETLFMGGGTPSLFSAEAIQQLLEHCRTKLEFADNIEITMEANPGSSEQKKFAALIDAGVNRLSLGIQSFNDAHLKKIGRIHNSSEAKTAVTAAKQAGFKRINIDLMHGLPGQTPAQALNDLQQAISLGVEHISWYQLTIEQNTEFYRCPPLLPMEDTLADIYDAGIQLLQTNGFEQYEISAYCKNGQQARHNINYWQFGDYLAIGAGAHGKITLPNKNKVIRYHKTRTPKDYLTRTESFVAEVTVIENSELMIEGLINCLRLTNGMLLDDFLKYTSTDKQQLLELCQPLINDGLITLSSSIKATELGRQYLNNILVRIIQIK